MDAPSETPSTRFTRGDRVITEYGPGTIYKQDSSIEDGIVVWLDRWGVIHDEFPPSHADTRSFFKDEAMYFTTKNIKEITDESTNPTTTAEDH